jgi:PAS domain S-box-containing protein
LLVNLAQVILIFWIANSMTSLPTEDEQRIPISETVRSQTLAEHGVSVLGDDPTLTALTQFAAKLCDVPIALISLVEEKRQWFLARAGLSVTETPRETSFCAHAMVGDGIMTIPDARADPKFADNPLVTGAPGIRFYAGAPLVSEDGIPLGSLCVIDTLARAGLTELQREGLTVLAASVITSLTSRRSDLRAQRQHDEQEERFRILADSMPQMVWSTLPDGFHDYYNARWYEFTGMPVGSTDGGGWNGMFHPEDQERAFATWRHSLATGDPYEIEYRLRDAAGQYRWTLGRALPMRGPDGEIRRWFGTCTDIDEQKRVAQQREILAHELSHRIKNIFAVIGGLVMLTARRQPELKQQADDLRDRIMALGRAHDFVRPHSEKSRPASSQTSFQNLIWDLLKPYAVGSDARISITGIDVPIDDRSATPLALTFHELATNAAKYGSLSVDEGDVEIAVSRKEATVEIIWRERGGPLVASPQRTGFGTELLTLSAVHQLGGKLHQEWRPDGLVVTVAIPEGSMHRT